jgi:ribulose-bisphosphate carboxylase large chain
MSTFDISYRVTVLEGETIDEKIEGICLEQSVELPRSVLSGEIETKVVGRLSSKKQIGDDLYQVKISWPIDNIGSDISQFLNILYGNISLQAGILVTGVEWDKLEKDLFGGPAFGIDGLREKYGISKRALSSTSLKPLGTDASGIGNLCYQFAAGGLDVIKDDHGISNQPYAPFEPRVKACVKGIQKAADETGHRAFYFPHITALAAESIKRYEMAAEMGADGVLICPHIAGMETMHQLARMDLPLPIIAHPAFSGGLTTNEMQGLSPDFLYGELWRALGADFLVYPNTGGRFSFTLEQCKAINSGARNKKLPFKPSFPMPGGGMKRSNIPGWLETYGTDTVFLLGTSLYEHPEGPRMAAEELSGMLK